MNATRKDDLLLNQRAAFVERVARVQPTVLGDPEELQLNDDAPAGQLNEREQTGQFVRHLPVGAMNGGEQDGGQLHGHAVSNHKMADRACMQ